MDRYFGEPIAQQKSKILGSDAADETEKAGGKKKADKKKAATETANPAKSDPKDKIRIYMMNDR
ncbi:MAG TPA: hypothetical protein DEB39_09575, partial [Planctomycetaceae bacterium]|nr:hypothetical protein [Planctomycetaceae bacterium]